jgi:D-alanyl-D-alanine carboxypeptidase
MRRIVLVAALATLVLMLASCGGSDGSTSGSSSPAKSNAPTPTSSPSWPKPTNAVLPKATVDQLQDQLTSYITEKKLVGVTAAVVTRDGSWAGAAGVDGVGKTIHADSALGIASTTKTFVAAEILLLAQEGKIKLDAPVTDYVTLPFDSKGATIRQLASMTAGFPDLPNATLLAKFSADRAKQWSCTDVVALVDPNAPRLGTLGGTAAYNGVNYYVLGLVIEKVTGQPLATVLRTDLLAPTGLSRIWTQTGRQPEKPTAPLAYPVDDTATPVVETSSGHLPSAAAATGICAGGGIAADAPNLARWGYLLYGGHVIDNTLVTIMTTANPQGGDFSYGFGTMVSDDNGAPVWGHAGNWAQYTSMLLVWPKDAIAVSVLVPMTGGPDNDVRGDLAFQLKQTAQASS